MPSDFAGAFGNRREVGLSGDLHFIRCLWINSRQHRSGCRRGGGFLRRGGLRRELHQIRSVAPLDRIDSVEHRGVDHRHHTLSHVRVGAAKAGHWRNGNDGFLVPIGDDIGES